MKPPVEFLGEAWIGMVGGVFMRLAPQTVEVLGDRSVTFAERYTHAETPDGVDGWFVTIGKGRVLECRRGIPDAAADLTGICTFATALRLATARTVDPTAAVATEVAEHADREALIRLGPLFADVHAEVAESTYVT